VGTISCTGCPVFQHTLAESWASQPVEARVESLLHGRSMVKRVDARLLDGVLKGNHLNFLILGDSEIRRCLVPPSLRVTSISSPLLLIVVA